MHSVSFPEHSCVWNMLWTWCWFSSFFLLSMVRVSNWKLLYFQASNGRVSTVDEGDLVLESLFEINVWNTGIVKKWSILEIEYVDQCLFKALELMWWASSQITSLAVEMSKSYIRCCKAVWSRSHIQRHVPQFLVKHHNFAKAISLSQICKVCQSERDRIDTDPFIYYIYDEPNFDGSDM